jgi:hypothetical protein
MQVQNAGRVTGDGDLHHIAFLDFEHTLIARHCAFHDRQRERFA